MVCRYCNTIGKCQLFIRRKCDSNYDDEGYCLLDSDGEYPEDSCDNYEI